MRGSAERAARAVLRPRPPADVPRTAEDLDDPALTVDHAVQVEGARLVFADHRRLLEDFPWLRDLAPGAEPDAETGGDLPAGLRRAIDDWVLRHAGVISVSQAAQTEVNTPIRTRGHAVEVYRLPKGGRSVYVPVGAGTGGLLSVKGAGLAPGARPERDPIAHANGLLPLHEIFREILTQLVVERIVEHAGEGLRGLPVYAVIDLGFDVLGIGDDRWQAGVMVRRASRRPRGGWDLPLAGSRTHRLSLDVELLLRRYGVTSVTTATTYSLVREGDGGVAMYHPGHGGVVRGDCPESVARALWDAYAPSPAAERVDFGGINVQMTRVDPEEEPELVDFGCYRACESFEDPILSMVLDRESNWGGVVPRGSPHFVQPEPRLAVPAWPWQEAGDVAGLLAEVLGDSDGDAAHDYTVRGLPPFAVDVICLALAARVRAGRLDGGSARSVLAGLAHGLTAHWP